MKEIKIKKGCKYTWSILPKIFIIKNGAVRTISKEFMFTESCLYDSKITQVNKLWGFSVGLFTSPRKESYRFGWNCQKNNGKIQIFEYVEKDYKFEYEHILDVDINKWYTYVITKSYRSVRLEIYDENNKLLVNCVNDFEMSDNVSLCKTARPYFGGRISAPHDIIIKTK